MKELFKLVVKCRHISGMAQGMAKVAMASIELDRGRNVSHNDMVLLNQQLDNHIGALLYLQDRLLEDLGGSHLQAKERGGAQSSPS